MRVAVQVVSVTSGAAVVNWSAASPRKLILTNLAIAPGATLPLTVVFGLPRPTQSLSITASPLTMASLDAVNVVRPLGAGGVPASDTFSTKVVCTGLGLNV